MRPGLVSPSCRVQVARWQPRPCSGHAAPIPRLVCRAPCVWQCLRGCWCLPWCPVCALRNPSTPSSATRVADQLGGGLAAPLMQAARGGDPRTPRGLLAHLSLGALAPHAALRASLPLFCFRPPPPCPWAAMTCRATAGLLRCCLCLLVNVDALPALSPVHLVPGHHRPGRLQRASPARGPYYWPAGPLSRAGSSPTCRGPAGPRPLPLL